MALCSNCGAPLGDGVKFCGACGHPVEAEPAAAATDVASAGAGAAETAATDTTAATAAATGSTAAAAAEAGTPPAPPYTPPAYVPPAQPQAPAYGQGQGYQQPYYPQGAYAPGAYPPGAYAAQPPKKSNKGLWIGLGAAVVIIAVAAALIFGVFKDKIFGDDEGSTAGVEGVEGAQGMLLASWEDMQDMTSASGTYEIAITMDTDTSSLSEEEQMMMAAFMGSPITVSGDFAFTQEPAAVELSAQASLFGMAMNIGLKMVDGEPYIGLSDKWYETPPEAMEDMAEANIELSPEQMQELLSELSLDPSRWIEGLEEVGDETINEEDTVHVTGSPNVEQMMTDLVEIMQNEKVQALLGAASEAGEDSGIDTEVPTEEELEEVVAQMEELFKDATIDLWLSKDDNRLCRMKLDVNMVAPEDGAMDDENPLAGLSELGLNGIGIAATMDFFDEKVSIEAPSSPLPYTELESALETEMGMLGMFLEGGF